MKKDIILEKDGLYVKAQAFMGTFEGYPDWQCTQDMIKRDISHITKNGWTSFHLNLKNKKKPLALASGFFGLFINIHKKYCLL